MLDINFVMRNAQLIRQSTLERYSDADVEKAIRLYTQLKDKRHELEAAQRRLNEIAQQFSKADTKTKKNLKEESRQWKNRVVGLKEEIATLEKDYFGEMLKIPNIAAPEVPQGKDEAGNVLLRQNGQQPHFDFRPRNHVELAELLDVVDFKSGTKVAGPKFYFLKNEAVLLELALIRYALDTAAKNGFALVTTPDIARDDIISASGFTPRGPESQIYSLVGSNLSLIGTSEITIGGSLAGSRLAEKDLPIKMAGVSHCFRTEAGSYGKESKGLYRVHQFSKVELYQFTHPEHSNAALEEILAIEESFYQSLGLPYRVMLVCKGDLGAPAYKKYDIEAWMPFIGSQGGYGEVTSASNCTDFQARRLDIRYHDDATRRNGFVHTLNGTAVATTRTILAILENHQREDGAVVIPEVLHPYTGFEVIKPKQKKS